MKKYIFLLSICTISLLSLTTVRVIAQGVIPPSNKNVTKSSDEIKKLREAVLADPSNLKAHQAYLDAFSSAQEAQSEYNEWMKKYPKIAAIPLSIGKKLYSKESPKATPYLLKAAQLEPGNAEIWEMLANDASRWGQEDKYRQYLSEASAADPKNVELAYSLASSFKYIDTAQWRKKTWQLWHTYPNNPVVAAAISNMGYNTGDPNKKIAIYEKLKTLYSPKTNNYCAVAMGRLGDAYIQEGRYDKAIKLSDELGSEGELKRFNFAQKKKLAEVLESIDVAMKAGKYQEAKEKAITLSVPRGLNVGSRVVLTKATTLDAVGATQAAYDSLVVFQAKKPDARAQMALERYGQKLGKKKGQLDEDILTAIEKDANSALPFQLVAYGDKKQYTLDDVKGKVVLLTFWFPGCGPCRAEMAHFQNVIKKFDKNKVLYLGVNVTAAQNDYVLPFMKNTQYSFTAVNDPTGTIEKSYNVSYCPTNFILDQHGKIAYSNFSINADNEDTLELMLKNLIQK